MIALARYGAAAACVVAVFLLAAAIGALLRHEDGAAAFLATALLTIFGAGAVYLGLRNVKARLGRLSSFALLLVLWLGIPAIAAFPIYATTPFTFAQSWFEAISAFTTTGGGAIHDVDALPRATLGWLLTLQWTGGLLTLVGFVAVLGPAGVGGLPDHAERSHLLRRSGATSLSDALRQVLPFYFGATLICTLMLYAVGVRVFDALGLAGAALSTGSVLPDADGMAAYGHFAVKLVMMLFMLIGGTSILWHRMILSRRFRLALGQQENLGVVMASLIVGILAAAGWYATPIGHQSLPLALEDGLFAGIALVTTTAIEPHAGAFAVLPLVLVLMVVFVGGASFSSSGGIKMYRAAAMAVQSSLELERLVHPNAVHPRRLGQQSITMQMMKSIWLCFGVACCVVVILTAAIAPAMPSFESALVAIVAAISNAGPIYSAGWTEGVVWPDWIALPAYAQLILAIAMILGRLEILVVMGLAHFAFWRR
ncbi:trk system potassium uptake protein TrkH [Ancylobacter sp. 3268]|uniref:potassium transporter TrkG n=1 Tax=Ancylobacter sp. 3268 TaxID=2817752 RepID=UPI0028678556|nr:potassium transporter TrkG [Ancylobacter sp. 3268]MDR6951025.1 trk system potassium uptake protein TrkH [Ancylobacter sp. 3268]